MITMTLQQAAELLGVMQPELEGEFKGISIDTRTIAQDNLFFAIPGKMTDGHQHLFEAKQKGAKAAIVMHKVACNLPQIQVTDTFNALGKLASFWRSKFQLPIIAATGSNGKTTLKNMLAAILRSACHEDARKVLANRGNFNNHLGLPLTLAELNKDHVFAVLEMGMNHFGEIDYLSRLAKPDIAIINNAAAAHLDGVGDVAGVARAKAEIFSGLTIHGTAILNRDDAFYDFWRAQIGNRKYITFGLHHDADVTAILPASANHVHVRTPQGHLAISLPLIGRHNVLNALAATAATIACGIDLAAIKQGLENIQPEPGRLQVHSLPNQVNIIDDTYNANPFSLQAGVEALKQFSGKRIVVLGDMKELGKEEVELHQAAGRDIRAAGIDFLFTYGELSEETAAHFGDGGFHFTDQEKLIQALRPFLCTSATILIKGSRSMHMERVVHALLQK